MFDLPNIAAPISVFLIPFGIFMFLYILYSLFNIYHLIRYGIFGKGLYFLITIFSAGAILLSAGSIFILLGFDWGTSIGLQEASNLYNNNVIPGL
jgi:hypothetical protein